MDLGTVCQSPIYVFVYDGLSSLPGIDSDVRKLWEMRFD